MNNLRNIVEKINISKRFKGTILTNEPMKFHTSFRIGGPAEIFVIPRDRDDIAEILKVCKKFSIPYFILGEGANILVSDMGISGMVIDLTQLRGIKVSGTSIEALSGTPISDVSRAARDASLTGMEFIYSMPGSTGGAVWMNARCYGKSISEVLDSVEYVEISPNGETNIKRERINKRDFGYKKSPFQKREQIITSATFKLSHGEREKIAEEMRKVEEDRKRKGHFLYPCAGSVFKNNRAFGMPTGEIIEQTGLKGYRIGDAEIAPFHANIIINKGNASATDVLKLIELVEKKVFNTFGFKLEREILLVGRW